MEQFTSETVNNARVPSLDGDISNFEKGRLTRQFLTDVDSGESHLSAEENKSINRLIVSSAIGAWTKKGVSVERLDEGRQLNRENFTKFFAAPEEDIARVADSHFNYVAGTVFEWIRLVGARKLNDIRVEQSRLKQKYEP